MTKHIKTYGFSYITVNDTPIYDVNLSLLNTSFARAILNKAKIKFTVVEAREAVRYASGNLLSKTRSSRLVVRHITLDAKEDIAFKRRYQEAAHEIDVVKSQIRRGLLPEPRLVEAVEVNINESSYRCVRKGCLKVVSKGKFYCSFNCHQEACEEAMCVNPNCNNITSERGYCSDECREEACIV